VKAIGNSKIPANHLDLFREASSLRVARQCTDQNVPTR
jgi:hypothetical protein